MLLKPEGLKRAIKLESLLEKNVKMGLIDWSISQRPAELCQQNRDT